MNKKDQFAKVNTFTTEAGGKIIRDTISSNEADLQIIQSVLKINFVLHNKLGIALKENSAVEMFLEFIEKLGKFDSTESKQNDSNGN